MLLTVSIHNFDILTVYRVLARPLVRNPVSFYQKFDLFYHACTQNHKILQARSYNLLNNLGLRTRVLQVRTRTRRTCLFLCLSHKKISTASCACTSLPLNHQKILMNKEILYLLVNNVIIYLQSP